KNGVQTIQLDEATVQLLFQNFAQHPGYRMTVDLESQKITDEFGLELSFNVDEFRRYCLLNGLDDIALTLQHDEKIAAYEAEHGIVSS
ncbi:MAG: 3-isopropylmalate dehydratase small subunit, partial [Planctomycetes bacterium]|nr:3-isopropylmalate dehydratase small subunit [Planctomycetota bacterium]